MKRKHIIAAVILAAVLLIAVLIFSGVYTAKRRTIGYVESNLPALEDFAAQVRGGSPDADSYNGWRVSFIPEYDMVDFLVGSKGLVPSGIYYGFYYSHVDSVGGHIQQNRTLREYGRGFMIEENDSENREYVEKIADGWYWYELHY